MTQSMTGKVTKALSLPLLILLLGFPQISETIYTPALPQVAKDLSTSSSMAELSLSIYFIGFAVGVALWGYCCDLFGRRFPMLIGIGLYVISCLVLWSSFSIESLLFWRFFQALGASAGSVVTQTMIRDVYDGKERHQLFSLLGAALSLSPALGAWIGGYLCMAFGWKMNFLALTSLGTLLLVICIASLPETRSNDTQKIFKRHNVLSLFKGMIKDTNILNHILLIAACNGIFFGFYAEAPFLFIELMGFTPMQYGFFGIVLCAAGLIAALLSHRMNEKQSPQTIIFVGSLISLIGSFSLLAIVAAGYFNTQISVTEISLLIMSIAITFIGVGLIIPNSLSIALADYRPALGIAGAIFGFLYYIGIAGFTALMSFFHNGTAYPMPLLFISMGLCLLICGFLIRSPNTASGKLAQSKA